MGRTHVVVECESAVGQGRSYEGMSRGHQALSYRMPLADIIVNTFFRTHSQCFLNTEAEREAAKAVVLARQLERQLSRLKDKRSTEAEAALADLQVRHQGTVWGVGDAVCA